MPAPRDVERYIKELEQRISLLERRQPLANSGMRVTAPGEVELTGNLTITGNLTAEGKISNDALTDPIIGNAKNISSTGFALAASALTELAGLNITVPAGYSRLVGTMGAYVFAYNPNTTGGSNGAGGDAIYAQARLGSANSKANPIGISGSGGFATSSSGGGFEFSGLTSGATLRLAVYGSSAFQAFGANVDNYANAFAALTWLR